MYPFDSMTFDANAFEESVIKVEQKCFAQCKEVLEFKEHFFVVFKKND